MKKFELRNFNLLNDSRPYVYFDLPEEYKEKAENTLLHSELLDDFESYLVVGKFNGNLIKKKCNSIQNIDKCVMGILDEL
jgi:hypothetical protein